MRKSQQTNKTKQLLKMTIPILVVVFPFVYLFPYILPLGEYTISAGNDFYILYYDYKIYLLDSLSRLQIPFWSPSEAAGFPFYSSPFTQTFYPLNAPLALLYNLLGGYSPVDHHRFTVFGIAIFALGLFLWLRRLNLNLRSVLFGALIMSVSFKVTELLRFPNAIHTAAWYPWVLYSITGIFQSELHRFKWLYGAIFFSALIFLVTGGYPYYVFYLIFLLIPYLSLFLIPEFRGKVFGINVDSKIKTSFLVLFTAGLSALTICAPYLYKMASLMAQTTDRGGKSYEYSTEHLFNLTDTVGSLFFPPAAQLEGIYYFGAVPILLILLYVFIVVKNLIRPDLNSYSFGEFAPAYFKLTLFLLIWAICISYITYGRESYLFSFLWYSVPLFSSLRVWGRMNIILVPVIAWLLALAYQYFEMILVSSQEGRRQRNTNIIVYLSIITVAIFSLQFSYVSNKIFDSQWVRYVAPVNIPALLSQYFAAQEQLHTFFAKIGSYYASLQLEQTLIYRGFVYIFFTLMGFFLVIFIVLYFPRKTTSKYMLTQAWIFMFVFSVANIALDGPWLWAGSAEKHQERTLLSIDDLDILSFNFPRIHKMGISLSGNFNTGVMANWYFERYVTLLGKNASDHYSLGRLLGSEDGKKLYFSERIDYLLASEFLQDAQRFEILVDIVSYNGDKLVVNVDAPKDGFLSFVDNWDQDWRGEVDGEPAPILLLLGTFKSVQIPQGSHQIIFEYHPTFFR